MKDGNTQTLSETIEDETVTAEDSVYRRRMFQVLSLAIREHLKEREQNILQMRYGLCNENEKKMTLDEIGQIYGVTRECIRQTEKRALKKLKNSCYLEQMVY